MERRLQKRIDVLDYLNDKISEVLESETLTYTSDMELAQAEGESDLDYWKKNAKSYRSFIKEAHYSFDRINALNIEMMELLGEINNLENNVEVNHGRS